MVTVPPLSKLKQNPLSLSNPLNLHLSCMTEVDLNGELNREPSFPLDLLLSAALLCTQVIIYDLYYES